MKPATKEFLHTIDELAKKRIDEIKNSKDDLSFKGCIYYVSNGGNDDDDGQSPETAWKSLERVSDAELSEGDAVNFRRGDLFRGTLKTKSGVTYCAYGNGEKPRFYAGERDMADPTLWSLYDEKKHIWKCTEKTLDAGTAVFNHGEAHSRKLIPSYIGGRFVCRENPNVEFDVCTEMTQNLDLFCDYAEETHTRPSRGEDFPIPRLTDKSLGDLYLRCDQGNPGEVFESIELLSRRHMILVGVNSDVHIDNLCLKYIGEHAVAAGTVKNLKVTNCEIGWVGGAIQHYDGTDPNYPQGTRGTVTRYGNAVEVYGGCDGYEVSNCYIYQVYDAGITHQVTTGNELHMDNIIYRDNLIEYCVYGIEYFLDKVNDNPSSMNHVEIFNNILRFSGYGWGQQRHNTHTPAHIKGWSYENTARDFVIHNNIFDRSAYRMIHLVAEDEESCPKLYENTYIQKYGMTLGQFGSNKEKEPEIIGFFENAEEKIQNDFGDQNAEVYYIE